MKRLILLIFLLPCLTQCFAQETMEVRNRLTDSVTEVFRAIKTVIKTDPVIKQGSYRALFRRRIIVANGNYTNNIKTGVWHFYDTDGKLIETFDYDTRTLIFEAHEDTTSYLRYLVDTKLADTDRVTKPIKIGGRYYGYVPYLQTFKFPFNDNDVNTNQFDAQIQLLISPLGRLAEYKIRIWSKQYQYDRTTTMSLNLLKDEDKVFVPATINDQPVLCRIVIRCYVTSDGEINFY